MIVIIFLGVNILIEIISRINNKRMKIYNKLIKRLKQSNNKIARIVCI